ncbi:putative membrane protein [Cellulomonas marina]|uniref:Putative membrane protein n=2 Tax=Cellulomonas marina TaxID=988821 RepID=A0A1I1AWT0_9CELL|nr:putative membrane protein [Cellulomonas marina]
MSWCLGLGAGGWLMLAASVAVLALAVRAVLRLFPASPAPDPVAVLETRLASGEIDVDTYRILRNELAGRVPAGRRTL